MMLAALIAASALRAQTNYPAPYTITTIAGQALVTGSTDGSGANARFASPQGIAVDRDGYIYVADQHTIRKISPYPGSNVTTLAGLTGVTGSADGIGSNARFNWPRGVAVDGSGNVYVADWGNETIRKITPDGNVSTVAGSAGLYGWVDGAGGAARFGGPWGIAVDGAGNLYVAEVDSNVIRKITADGIVTTIAGTGYVAGSADGIGSAAQFSLPMGLAIDKFGNLFVADYGNCTIR